MQASEIITLEMKAGALEAARASVIAGEYTSLSEAVEDALLAWQQNRIKADQLASIRARLQQSLDDPHPDLTGAEVDQHLEKLFQSSPATKHA